MGNVHSKDAFYYYDAKKPDANGNPVLRSEHKMKDDKVAKVGAVKVRKMLLKDNDCGVSRSNLDKDNGLLQKVAHVDPNTYQRVLKLNSIIDAQKSYFLQVLNFTENDFKSVRGNLSDIAKYLHDGCVSGKVKVDLDLQTYFSGRALTKASCELAP